MPYQCFDYLFNFGTDDLEFEFRAPLTNFVVYFGLKTVQRPAIWRFLKFQRPFEGFKVVS